ncbi:hypothetical protein CVD28_01385 [Bacillus sp. M6-12]|uniref:DUF5362 family protein n=1 Tax=Bacillus sp. M6-12 TaxID=2054166 RepID=UPI000C784184|nr:DUF5362 family protein [Bacillus sp. M6-12]PLS19087.1 hypothetical protein CVD28_01385 [Bacillus sp. M6-12]
MIQEHLKKLSFWGKFVGWTLLISGGLSTLIGAFAFLVGAIPGLVTIYMGWKLIKASENADRLYHEANNEEAFQSLLKNYLSFFKTQGILLIVMFVIYGLMFLLMALGVFGSLASMSSL